MARCACLPRLRRRRSRGCLPLRRQLLALPRVRAAERSVVRDGARLERPLLRRERRARRPAAARRRLPAARLPIAPAAGATPSSTSCTACPAGRARSSRRSARGRRGRAGRAAQAEADDPRDAVRLDGQLHRRGVGERRPAGTGLGDLPRARCRAARSTRATGRSRRWRASARRSLRGRLRRAQHRPPPSGRVPRARELVGLRARRRHRLGLRPPRRVARGEQPGARSPARRRRSGGRTRSSGSTAAPTTSSAAERRRSPRALARAASPHRFLVVRGGHNWALWRGNAARACSPPRGGSLARRARAPSRRCSRSGSRPAAGSTSCASALPGPRVGDALPLDELSRTRRRRSSGSSPSGAPPGSCSVSMHAGRGSSVLTAALLLGARCRAAGYLQTGAPLAVVRQISIRDALDLAARLPGGLHSRPCSSPLAGGAARTAASASRGRRSSSRRSSPRALSSTSCTRSSRARTRVAAFADAGRRRPARPRGRRARRRSRCSSRPAGSRAAVAGPGRWRPRSPCSRPRCTRYTVSTTAPSSRRSCSRCSRSAPRLRCAPATPLRSTCSSSGSPSRAGDRPLRAARRSG